MAVKKKAAKRPAKEDAMQEKILQFIGELLGAHIKEIREVIDQSEDKKVSVSFGTVIDCSESTPSVKTSIRFATTITDVRTGELDDPDQTPLPLITEPTQEQINDGCQLARAEGKPMTVKLIKRRLRVEESLARGIIAALVKDNVLNEDDGEGNYAVIETA